MKTIDLTSDNLNLADNADTRHESAEDWYDSFGWHLSTRSCGDVCLQSVKYDALDNTDDDDVTDILLAHYPQMRRSEAVAIVSRAREVREWAESIESLLDEAVAAYESGDLSGCVAALRECEQSESEGGDCPATSELAERLLEECDEEDET